MLSKETVKEAFSKAAFSYDGASDFQKETGDRLINRVLADSGPKDMVLDVGMGTGAFTQQLSKRLGRRVYGCDIAWGMAAFSKSHTKGLFIAQADMERLPYRKGAFDILFSNIAYQWACDFRPAFSEAARALKEGGRFYFSVLLKGSLKELYYTIESFVGKGFDKDFLPGGERVGSELEESGLKIIWREEQIIKRYYASLIDLLEALKGAGAARVSQKSIFGMGKRRLFFEMIERYDRDFKNGGGKVFATYNVMFGCAKKQGRC